jgi:enediyne polyketide synthase
MGAGAPDGVVIAGLACRYPEADDPEQLWENVMSRRRSFRPIPPERLPLDAYAGTGPDQTYVTRAGLLDGWQFDRQRFRVPGETFRAVDLSHWLALEVCATALADAGLPDGDGIDHDRVGVVLGNTLTGEFSRAAALRTRWPYVRRAIGGALDGINLSATERSHLVDQIEQRYKASFPAPSDETLAGSLANTIAGRVCNYFDFHGTGYIVDGACAASLLAITVAAAAVMDGQLDVALAGGVDLSLDPFELVGFARLDALAHGEMRVYDRRPTGFLPGEGCGVVVLCRESFAKRNGLRAYARLLGWGTSSDGSGGLTRPESIGQRLALCRAYDRAGLDPALVGLVEGHGTGTEVGDLTELRALLEVRGQAASPAALGSVKANIGHTKAAAGVAGFIKVVLAVHHKVLPPTTGCIDPHPLLAEAGASLRIANEAQPWSDAERFAAVSAFGFGGINAHAVIAGSATSARCRLDRRQLRLAGVQPSREVIVCAADRPEELERQLLRLGAAARQLSAGELTDLAATLAATHTSDAPVRFAAAVADPEELARAAEQAAEWLAAGEQEVIDPIRRAFVVAGGPLRVALLCSGQASPCYPDAGAMAHLLSDLPPGYDDQLPLQDAGGGPVGTAVAQPAIMRSILAGLRWLDALGVQAYAAVGHSLGELGALCWAGAISEADVYALARARGTAMASAEGEPGAMASLRATQAVALDLLAETAVVVAADNGELRTVVSGSRDEVGRVVDKAVRRGIGATWLPVAHAFHSPAMASATDAVRAAAEAVRWSPIHRKVASTVTADWLSSGDDLAELLVEQLTAPVRFREALALPCADLLVEVGPGRVLADLAGQRAVALDTGSQSADGVATVTAALFAAGACDSAEAYFERRFTRRFDLERPRAFLVNPCEKAAKADVGQLPAVEPASPKADLELMLNAETAPDPLAVTLARVALAVELDPDAIMPDTRLLADLHLNSLRVGQLAAEVADHLGRATPTAPLDLATATVKEFAATIAALPPADAGEPPVAGVADWLRVFGEHLMPRPATYADTVTRAWEIVGDLDAQPLVAEIRAAFPAEPPGAEPTRLLALAPDPGRIGVDGAVRSLQAAAADQRPLVVLHHGGIGAAVGRSLAAEYPDVPILVVDVPATAAGIAAAAAEAHRPLAPYAEVVVGAGKVPMEPVLRPLKISPRRDKAIPLQPGDVCVVTGGARGIGLECALELGRATGATMVLLGRSAGHDHASRAGLERFAAAGVPAKYRRADVTDRAAIAAVLAALRAGSGPLRGLLHAAGRNDPALIADLTVDGLRSTLAPKADGFDNVLAGLDLSELRFAVTFGSVIGRTGLAGEAHYAIANEWLSRRCAQLSATTPDVRWLNVEWSAWSGTGMGERLGTLDGLIRQGLTPISIAEGTDLLLRLLATPDLPPSVLVAGRLPATPTLLWEDDQEVSGRFVASRNAHTPGVELVAGAKLSVGNDPMLVDHRIDGTIVLPAVLGLEAMAQVCAALGGKPEQTGFSAVTFSRPVTVPDLEGRSIRVAALVAESGDIDVVTRSDETGFAVDHFRGTCSANSATNPASGPLPAVLPKPDSEPMPGRPLYGPLFFHGPAFQRVRGYHQLSAYRCLGSISADPEARWFGTFHDQRLLLGDPGARDAFLHILQGCLPNRRLVPVAAAEIRTHRRLEGLLTIHARQRAEEGDELVFDFVVSNHDQLIVEEWHGLRLRAVGPLAQPRLPVELLGAYVTRSLRHQHPNLALDLAVAPAARTDRQRTQEVASWLLDGAVIHATDGALVSTVGGSASASHIDGFVLVAASAGRVAVDCEVLGPADVPLPDGDRDIAAELARSGAPDVRSAAYRVWTCREVLRKLGSPRAAPLVVKTSEVADWMVLEAAGHALHSTVVVTTAGPVAICIGIG